jgi:carbamoyltransferase
MSKILGISCYYHDSAACYLVNGKIMGAVQEERFTRKKHDSSFPLNSIKYLMNEYTFNLSELDKIVFYENNSLKFSRIVCTYIHFSPNGFFSFIKVMSKWLGGQIFFKKNFLKNLKKIDSNFSDISKIYYFSHHASHAASAFYPSPFKEAAILTIDGVGEWATTTISHGKENQIKFIKELHFPNSLGLLYSAFTYYLGFKVDSGEYKVMGLAPYGEPKYLEVIKNNLIDIKDDGSFRLNMKYFDYPVGFKMTNSQFEKLFNNERRNPEKDKITEFHMDMAASIQKITEEIILKICKNIKSELGVKNLCLAGGVALNCVANGKILKENLFKNIWIQPAAGDAGGALGAALNYYYNHENNVRNLPENSITDSMRGSFLGPNYTSKHIRNILENKKLNFKESLFDEIIDLTTDQLISGKIIGWFRGRAEFGPRALGNRSIIADPRDSNMQKKLNLKIKFREGFRPFAPAILEEEVQNYFDTCKQSPYMLLVSEIKNKFKKNLESKSKYSGFEKLSLERSIIPAVTHIDYSSRLQTVSKEINKEFYELIKLFYKKTNCPAIINTSFNIRSEPIVNSVEDAVNCFFGTDLDILVIENFILFKKDQNPRLINDYRNRFELD